MYEMCRGKPSNDEITSCPPDVIST